MKIGKVVGNVVSTQKDPSHEGRKILLVQPVNLEDLAEGETVLALDSVDAGVGDRVLLVEEGWSAATVVGRQGSPIDAAIVGVVDEVRMT